MHFKKLNIASLTIYLAGKSIENKYSFIVEKDTSFNARFKWFIHLQKLRKS